MYCIYGRIWHLSQELFGATVHLDGDTNHSQGIQAHACTHSFTPRIANHSKAGEHALAREGSMNLKLLQHDVWPMEKASSTRHGA